MTDRRHRYRLYDLVVESPSELSLSPTGADEADDPPDQPWRYEEGPVEPPSGRCVHDIADFDGQRRLKVWIDDERGVIFSHGDTRVEWNSARRRIRMEVGDDMEMRRGIVLERMVAPIALMIEREHYAALHASAVGDGDGTAWVFVGDSGAGKSTTALELMRRGLEILADDLVVVDATCRRLSPATPSVRLFDRPDEVPEAIDTELVMPEIEKYWYQLPHRCGPRADAEVQAIYALQPDDTTDAPRVEKLRGRQATVALLAQAFDLTEPFDEWRAARFRTLCQLARQIPVFRVVYAHREGAGFQQVDAIFDHLHRPGPR